MVKLDNFIINLTRENAVYYAGEEVRGNLLIKSREQEKLNSIVLEFKGEAYFHEHRRHISQLDTYFEMKEILMQKQDETNDLYLKDYHYNFPFRFTLPTGNLPTSYEYFNAHIRYYVKATIDIPMSINREAIRCFSVINPLDLNLIPSLRQPFGVSDTNRVCCGPCISDPILIDFNTTKTGFVCGETVTFNASVDNRSSRGIKKILASLVQHADFYGRESTLPHTHSFDIATYIYTGPKIGPRMQGKWANATFKIPTVCPSLLDTCRIIKVHYTLRLDVVFYGVSVDKKLNIPIVIGTVPFHNSNISLLEHISQSYSASSNLVYYKSVLDSNGFIRKSEDMEDEDNCEILNFTPKYPYYKGYSPDKFFIY